MDTNTPQPHLTDAEMQSISEAASHNGNVEYENEKNARSTMMMMHPQELQMCNAHECFKEDARLPINATHSALLPICSTCYYGKTRAMPGDHPTYDSCPCASQTFNWGGCWICEVAKLEQKRTDAIAERTKGSSVHEKAILACKCGHDVGAELGENGVKLVRICGCCDGLVAAPFNDWAGNTLFFEKATTIIRGRHTASVQPQLNAPNPPTAFMGHDASATYPDQSLVGSNTNKSPRTPLPLPTPYQNPVTAMSPPHPMPLDGTASMATGNSGSYQDYAGNDQSIKTPINPQPTYPQPFYPQPFYPQPPYPQPALQQSTTPQSRNQQSGQASPRSHQQQTHPRPRQQPALQVQQRASPRMPSSLPPSQPGTPSNLPASVPEDEVPTSRKAKRKTSPHAGDTSRSDSDERRMADKHKKQKKSVSFADQTPDGSHAEARGNVADSDFSAAPQAGPSVSPAAAQLLPPPTTTQAGTTTVDPSVIFEYAEEAMKPQSSAPKAYLSHPGRGLPVQMRKIVLRKQFEENVATEKQYGKPTDALVRLRDEEDRTEAESTMRVMSKKTYEAKLVEFGMNETWKGKIMEFVEKVWDGKVMSKEIWRVAKMALTMDMWLLSCRNGGAEQT